MLSGGFMLFDSKYGPTEIRRIFNTIGWSKGVTDFLGDQNVHRYFENESTFVLDAATDITDKMQKSILKTFEDLKEEHNGDNWNNGKKFDEVKQKKIILIPVSEQQKILGLFKRNHWVTLHYDPVSNQATLLDSRPAYVSFLYPKSAIENSLREGIQALYGRTKADEMKFQIKYQGVQLNDIYCGAWTTRNILDLAGEGKSGTPTRIDDQVKKYKSRDEEAVVLSNMQLINKESKFEKPSLFQRFLAFFRRSQVNTNTNELSSKKGDSPERIQDKAQVESQTPASTEILDRKSNNYTDDTDEFEWIQASPTSSHGASPTSHDTNEFKASHEPSPKSQEDFKEELKHLRQKKSDEVTLSPSSVPSNLSRSP